MDREAIRAKGKKAEQMADEALIRLGKLAWDGLNEPGKKLIFEKVNSKTAEFMSTTHVSRN